MKALLICMASWILGTTASAFYEKTTTDWYTRENPGNDPFVVHLLDKLEDGWAVMVNEGRIRKKGYYMASPITSEQGMSYYELILLRKVDGEWEREGYALSMCDVVDKKLKHSDERFVDVRNISLGVASSIFKSWREMNSSRNFENLISAKFTSANGSQDGKSKFIEYLNNEKTPLAIAVIGLEGNLRYSITVGYELRRWIIGCDIIDGVVKYLYVSEV